MDPSTSTSRSKVNSLNDAADDARNEKQDAKERKKALGLVYAIDENPPWYVSLTLGFQQFMTMIGGTLPHPFILSGVMCFANNSLVISEVLSTLLFVSGLITVLQSTFGVRLPIIQGGSFSFLAPLFAILSLPKWKCPTMPIKGATNSSTNFTATDEQELWQMRMREIQGAIMVSSVFQIFVGFSGVVGVLMKFIGPLTIAPTICLIGLSLFHVAAEHAGSHWGISMMTLALIILFSQLIPNYKFPIPVYSRGHGFHMKRFPIFKLFPIILSIAVSWAICAIVTAAGGFPTDSTNPNYLARTDARTGVLREAKWFRFPYPGQWGLPTVTAAGVFGMLAGVLVSVIESIGDYYACARLSGAPRPPKHAISRGIGIEGVGCLLAGAFGTGTGTTSYSENIGAIGITKVGSLRVIQYAGLLMMVLGVVGKVGALFTTIPDPIVGGMFFAMFGMITSVGISNLQFANMNSSRNIFIVGLALLMGLGIPHYMNRHSGAVKTGVDELDQIITVLLKTSMAVGGIVALVLDNLAPGTDEERGLHIWKSQAEQTEECLEEGEKPLKRASSHIYDLPFGLNMLSTFRCSKFVPFLPYYPPKVKRQENSEMVSSGRLQLNTVASTIEELQESPR